MPQRRQNPLAPRQTFNYSRGAHLMFMALGAVQTGSVAGLVTAAANRYGVDPGLALAVATRESSLNPNVADSPAGAIGVMQLEPATAASLGVDPRNLTQNIDGGVRYLSQLLSKYGGDVAKAVAGYDWGPGNLNRAISSQGDNWLSIAPAETQAYVAAVAGVTPADVASGAGAAPSDAGTFVIDPATGYLVPDTGAGPGDAAAAADQFSVAGLSTGELLALTGLGFGAYLLFRD